MRGSNGSATGAALVPWNQDPMTDALRLPRVVGAVYRTLKSSSVDSWITQSSTAAAFASTSFACNSLASDFASLAAVFDQYRVEAIEIRLTPHVNSATGSSATAMGGQLYTVIDYDDAATLSNVGQLMAYENCITTPAYQVTRRCFKPRIALAAYAGAFTSFASGRAGWIDVASGGVLHYGLKAGCDQGTTGALQSWDLDIKAIIEFRATR